MFSARSARRRELAHGRMPQEDLMAGVGDRPKVGLPIVGWFVKGLQGFGMQRIDQAQPFEARRRQLAELLRDMASTGLTGGHVMDLDEDGLELLAALDEAGELPLRLRLAPWCRPDDDGDRIDELLSMQKLAGRLWQIDAVKLFMDGTVDGGTAWLDEPDCHGESRYSYWQDLRDYAKAVRRFAHAGVQTATHAIGDAAVQYVLDTLEGIGSSAASAPPPNRAHRDAAVRPGPPVCPTRCDCLDATDARNRLHPRRSQ